MILEVLLVFTVNNGHQEISDRIFESYEECKEFVNTIAQNDVVNSDYGFRFLASDGVLFDGQCISQEDYKVKQGI